MRHSRIAALCFCALVVVGVAAWLGERWFISTRPEALVKAVFSGDIAQAERLLDAGEDPNIRITPYRSSVGSAPFTRPTLLVVAVAHKDLPLTKLLLRYGASPQIPVAKDGRTLAHVARTLPAPWSRLLNDPAYALVTLSTSPPLVNLRTLRRQAMLPFCCAPWLLIVLGLAGIWQGIGYQKTEATRLRLPFAVGWALLLLGLAAMAMMPTGC
jgi:hypothetical protein